MSIDPIWFLLLTVGPIGGACLAIAILYLPSFIRTAFTGELPRSGE